MVLLSSTVSFQILCLSICQLLTQRLSSPAVTVSLSISPCSSVGFCSTYFDALWLGSCWYVFLENQPFHPQHPTSFWILFLVLKLSLSEINIATLDLFSLVLARYIFLDPFTFNLSVSIFKMVFL